MGVTRTWLPCTRVQTGIIIEKTVLYAISGPIFAAAVTFQFVGNISGEAYAQEKTEDVLRVELVSQGVISTDRNETFSAENPSDGSLWFSVYDNSFSAQTIMVARPVKSGWATPTVVPFSGEWGDRAPRFSPDGTELFFTSNRPREESGSRGDMNIWRVVREGDSWSEPEQLDSPLNSEAQDIHSSVTREAVWVASNREGGYGRSDIYRIDHDGTMTRFSTPINDEQSQPDLYVSADETWMILVITDHPDGYGGDDLYLSRFDGESWSVPTNLGPEINTDEYEYGPTVSGDGEYLYFTSRPGDSADVYRVPLSDFLGGGR